MILNEESVGSSFSKMGTCSCSLRSKNEIKFESLSQSSTSSVVTKFVGCWSSVRSLGIWILGVFVCPIRCVARIQ
jgi:hypothetical protein